MIHVYALLAAFGVQKYGYDDAAQVCVDSRTLLLMLWSLVVAVRNNIGPRHVTAHISTNLFALLFFFSSIFKKPTEPATTIAQFHPRRCVAYDLSRSFGSGEYSFLDRKFASRSS